VELAQKRRFVKLGLGVLLSLVIGLVIFLLPRISPKFFTFEHKYSDWRTVFLSPKSDSQDTRLLLIKITEEDLAQFRYRSPIDRSLLTNLVKSIDNHNPKVIGIDILFDQPTEDEKDQALLDQLKSMNTPVVIGSIDDRYPATKPQKDHLQSFIKTSGARHGFLNLQADLDGSIRRMPHVMDENFNYSFADQIALTAGAKVPDKTSYWEQIAWAGPPKDKSNLFRETSAGFYMTNSDIARQWTENNIVLIGTKLLDSDEHGTPFSVLGEDTDVMSGVNIHAHIILQRLDGRRVRMISGLMEYLTYVLAIGTALGLFAKFSHLPKLAKASGILGIALIALDCFLFKFASLIIPTAMIVFSFSTVMSVLYLIDKYRKPTKNA
jgi:CHASE2 domain-containing sensor protein